MQLFARLKNSVGAGHAVSAAELEGTGIDDELTALVAADRLMSVAVDQAVRLWKMSKQARLNVVRISAETVPVGYSNVEAAQLKFQLARQNSLRGTAAAVAMHSMNGLAPENIQRENINNVSGMNDDFAVSKALLDSVEKIRAHASQVGV